MTPGGERVDSCKDIKDMALRTHCQATFEACGGLSGDGYQDSCAHQARSCIDMYLKGASSYPLQTSRGVSLTFFSPDSCFNAAVRLTKNLGPLKEFQKKAAEPAGPKPPRQPASPKRQESDRAEYEVCEQAGPKNSGGNKVCRERIDICLSSGPYGIPIGSHTMEYPDRDSCLRGVKRLSRRENEIKPAPAVQPDTGTPTAEYSPPDVPASPPPVEYPPPNISEEPPMEGRAEFFKTLLGIAIREIDASPNYTGRIDAILDRMSMRGINVKELGPVHHASAIIGGGALAMVINISNDFHVGPAGGYSDWLLELVLAHEYRHQIQNKASWEGLVTEAGLDPAQCSLQTAYLGENVPPEFKAVYERYLDAVTGSASRQMPFMELDAYLYMHDYYKKYLESEIDRTQYFIFNTFLRGHILDYLTRIYENYGLRNLTESEREVYGKAASLRNELGAHLNAFADENWARDFERDLGQYLDRIYAKYSGTLEFPDGENYSLRERLLVLQGATSEVKHIGWLSDEAARLNIEQRARFASIAVEADKKGRELDSLLNRQILRYSRQLRDNTPHAVEYRNDLNHTPDGLFRDQWFAEVDFGGKGEIKEDIRLGSDSAIYYHLSENIFLRSGFSLYGGYQTGIKNPMAGLRFDALQLHWDIPFTQSVGVSLFAGYSLGMHAGWEDSDVYDEARVGAEIFNF